MKIKLLAFLIFLSCYQIESQLTVPSNLQSYYSNVDFTLTSTSLFNDLAAETISKHSNILSYSERHDYLYNADADLSNSSNVILMYNGESRDKREYLSGNNSYNTQTFNTEHVYPQSLIGNTAKGDLHHLRSCDTSINGSRGNDPFIDSSSSTYGSVGSSWFPGNEWKGDVARMILYMNLRYDESITDIGTLNLFLKWNVEDPVSDFEIQRNEVISNVQGNRNPFIDNPYIATLIWGGSAAENTWSTLNTITNKLSNTLIYPNPVEDNKIFINTEISLSVEIFNVLGKSLIKKQIIKNQSTIDVSNLNKGIYLLKLSDDTISNTRKIIIR